MKLSKPIYLAVALVALSASMAVAQGAIGSEDNQITESRMPTVLTIEVADMDVSSFPVDIPFTMTGSPATVYLAVYTNLSDADLPGLTIGGEANWHSYQEVNSAVYVSPGSRFETGSHSISWDGNDTDGNAVSPSASYRFFVVGLDDLAPINMVGYTNARHTAESTLAIDQNGDLSTVTGGGESRLTADGPRHLIISKVGTNWLETPGAYQAINVEDELMPVFHTDDIMPAEWQGGGNGKQYGSLPGDFYGDSWDGTVYGAIKFNVDPANGTVTLDRNFGTEGDGRMKFEPFSDGNLKNGSTGIDVWDGRLYYPTYDRGGDAPAHANVGVQDAATGEVIDVLDLSEWLVVDVGAGNQAFSPHDIWVDGTGVYSVGYAGSQHVKISLDGELKWLNDNGDGFADRINPDTGEFDYGAFSRTPWNTSGSGSKDGWGFAFSPLLGSTTSTVDILGPDGTGILHMVPTHAPAHWPQWVESIEEDGPFDGLYWDIGSRRGGGTDPWDVPDYTGFPSRQAIHFPYDSKTALINPGATGTAVTELAVDATPAAYVLEDAFPNPFNPEATIRFSIPQDETVTLQIYSLSGQLVKTLHEGQVAAGTYQSVWDGTDDSGHNLASGVYLYNLEAGSFFESKKLTVLK
jgi:flagellar hook assembly protein FlgD